MAVVEIRFNVRRTKGFGGTQWQGEITIPADLAMGRARSLVARGAPADNQLDALIKAADFAERLVDSVPDDVIPTRSISKLKEKFMRAPVVYGDYGNGGNGKKKIKKGLKKAGKGLLKGAGKIIKGLF